MSQNFFSIWILLVWTTKRRQPLIHRQLKKPLYDKMREIANEKDFRIDFINGVEDHVHLLISIQPKHSVSDIVKHLKGITNSWVNKNQLTLDYFEWQDGFSAFSVSPLQLQKVRNYIRYQEKHHKSKGFDDEMQHFGRLTNSIKSY